MPGQLRKSFPEEMGPGGRMRNKKTVSKRKVPGEFFGGVLCSRKLLPVKEPEVKRRN